MKWDLLKSIEERTETVLATALILLGLVVIVFFLGSGPAQAVFSNSSDTILLISLSSIYLSLKSRLNIGYVLLAITIPICACDVLRSSILSLQTVSQVQEAFWQMSENLSVLIVGAIFSSLGYFANPKETDFSMVKPLEYYDIVILLLGFSVWLLWPMFFAGRLDELIHFPSVFLALSFIFVSVGAAMLKKTATSVAVVDGAVAVILFGLVLAACLYFTSLQEASQIGPFLALSLLISIYGCELYYFGFFLTIKYRSISQVSYTTKNWHIVEAIAFLIFMFFGPPTVWEAGGFELFLQG